MASKLAGQWVLITGASSGFGAAAAIAFAREGAKLLLGARRGDRLAQVAAEAKKAGAPVAVFHELDVSRTSSVETYAKWVRSQSEKLDVLINNAGGALGLDTVATGKDEDWEGMMQSNVLGVLRMTRAMLPLMTSNPGSAIINIGSIAGRVAYEGGAAYCAAKAGELQITRALRLELSGTGIRVATIDPGMAETEFSLVRFKGDAERARKVYDGVIPLRAEDVAEAILWVASRPPHVCIDEMIIKATDQAAIHKVYRRTAK
ncbi:MAG TPA: SDR family NAD(P)-dependent oxidoreductase [Candidatus Saccharimonadales bacterium]|nr:SDR family NAD(P)-dependent oxidoreductase [Candidatus Saccharimonadales bacterium]